MAMAGNVVTPKLRISSLGNNFARKIGEIGIHCNRGVNSSEEESTVSSKSEALDDETNYTSADGEDKENTTDLSNAKDFPLLHYLFSMKQHSSMDLLLREIKSFTKKLLFCYGREIILTAPSL
jgi:hypothetical protein